MIGYHALAQKDGGTGSKYLERHKRGESGDVSCIDGNVCDVVQETSITL
jgi:hypothetical protein